MWQRLKTSSQQRGVRSIFEQTSPFFNLEFFSRSKPPKCEGAASIANVVHCRPAPMSPQYRSQHCKRRRQETLTAAFAGPDQTRTCLEQTNPAQRSSQSLLTSSPTIPRNLMRECVLI